MTPTSDKQAVLLIHGIGEQQPMETLRGFVRAVWSTDDAIALPGTTPLLWSKPDTVSGNYDLRRLTTSRNVNGIRTDFFEYYWAHLMTQTRVWHVLAWARLLLVRWPWNVPAALRGVWLLVVGMTTAVTALFIVNGLRPEGHKLIPLSGWAAALVWAVLLALANAVVIGYIGDAARYFHRAPPNIGRRQEIRARGIAVLKKLHEAGYRRIIVVGHSLGSVIGYDILTHAWAEYNAVFNNPPSPQAVASLDALEALLKDVNASADQIGAAQSAYALELQANGNPWRVTDFVTAGSPLTHAALLLAEGEASLTAAQYDRELPTSPPVTETGRISYPREYTGSAGATRTLRVPHHAALFGPTRWTNLYFPARFVFLGDVIGGPLAAVFGRWIRDVAVSTKERWGFLSHTLYWSVKSKNVSEAVQAMRRAVDLAR